MPSIHEPAPDFKAEAVTGRGEPVGVHLADLRGRWAVVFFYPRDFSTICPTEIRELTRRAPELRALSAEVLAVSVDDLATHRRWVQEVLGAVAFPLVADPDRAISKAWGVLLEPDGVASRATFVVDPQGVVQHASYNARGVGRSVSEILRQLEALQVGERAPADWQPGQPTLGR